jgi:hypothetical protein
MNRKLVIQVVVSAIALTALILLYLVNPAGSRLYPPCPSRALTGLHCPGCGSLRATHLLLHGDIPGAFRKNPLLVLSIPVLAVLTVRRSWSQKAWVPWAALAVLVIYGVLRNIPHWPFDLLAPR